MRLVYDEFEDWWVWIDSHLRPVSPRFDYEEDAIQWKIVHYPG
jgi:hypothetical protein